jgi:hypothetical protein
MSDRRRVPRYQLCQTTRAEISLLQDVIIQSAVGDDLVVLSPVYPSDCDRLLVQFAGVNDQVTSLQAQVLGTEPVRQAGLVQFRVALRVNGFADLVRVNPLATLG